MSSPTATIPGYITGTWDIDPVHSDVSFVVRHLGVSKVRGRFDTFSGQLVTAENPLESSVTATIDATPSAPATTSATATCAARTSCTSASTRRSPYRPPACAARTARSSSSTVS